MAETAKVRILPVALAPTEIPDGMKYQLAGVQIVEVWQDYERGVVCYWTIWAARALEREPGRAQARSSGRHVAASQHCRARSLGPRRS